ncbi:hypothetical protein LJR267_009887 [Paraburkholderia hospita]|jgi:hypothetical protein|uniref:hypothetical protein n=1 Tax=Paraburkholderia hospita TaxID=169430 RepID=UPI003ECC8BCA
MKIGRRAFMLGAALCGVAPVFARLVSSFPPERSRESLMSEQLPSILTAGATEMSGVEFRIDGWNPRNGNAIDESPTAPVDPINKTAAVEAIWISVNQSWRSGWR